MSDQTIKAIVFIGGTGAMCLVILILAVYLIWWDIKDKKEQEEENKK